MGYNFIYKTRFNLTLTGKQIQTFDFLGLWLIQTTNNQQKFKKKLGLEF